MHEPSRSSPWRADARGAPRRTTWRECGQFLLGFARHPAQVGSVVPSSVWLEQRLVQAGAIAQARCVVELGPGTGGTTAALLRALPPSGRLLAIELDPGFHDALAGRLRDPRLCLALASAEGLPALLAQHGLEAPDTIVSGIPFSTMPVPACERIAARVAQALRPGGRFVAYQVRAHVARFAAPHFAAPNLQWEWRNVPPVRVFTWVKAAAAPA